MICSCLCTLLAATAPFAVDVPRPELAAVPPAVALPALASPAPLDTLIDVGGYRLHFVVHRGVRPLAIVLEAGGGASIAGWSGLEAELAARTGATVVAYERAGFGASELGPERLTAEAQVEDLVQVLARLGAPSRRVLVGHSYGGMMALIHAATYPEEVAGLVLVDPMNARFVEATGDFVHSTVPDIENPASDAERALARMIRTFDAVAAAAGRAEPSLRTPMVVITAGEPWFGRADIDSAWRASHAAIAAAGPNRRLVVAEGADHDVPEERPDLILAAVAGLAAAEP